MTDLLIIPAHILDFLRKLWTFRKWDKPMDINPEDKNSFIIQFQEALLKYVENKYCTKHRRISVIQPQYVSHFTIFPSTKASGFGQFSFDPYDLSSDDKEYWTPKSVPEATPRWRDRTACWMTAGRLYFNLPPEAQKNLGQVNPNLNKYQSDSMEISRTFWLPDDTDWWRQQEQTHSMYADVSNLTCDILSIIPHHVRV